jgi:hypothetical protein
MMSQAATAQDVPADYQKVLKIVRKSGDYKANVLKVNIPRNDLHMKVRGSRCRPRLDLADVGDDQG